MVKPTDPAQSFWDKTVGLLNQAWDHGKTYPVLRVVYTVGIVALVVLGVVLTADVVHASLPTIAVGTVLAMVLLFVVPLVVDVMKRADGALTGPAMLILWAIAISITIFLAIMLAYLAVVLLGIKIHSTTTPATTTTSTTPSGTLAGTGVSFLILEGSDEELRVAKEMAAILTESGARIIRIDYSRTAKRAEIRHQNDEFALAQSVVDILSAKASPDAKRVVAKLHPQNDDGFNQHHIEIWFPGALASTEAPLADLGAVPPSRLWRISPTTNCSPHPLARLNATTEMGLDTTAAAATPPSAGIVIREKGKQRILTVKKGEEMPLAIPDQKATISLFVVTECYVDVLIR